MCELCGMYTCGVSVCVCVNCVLGICWHTCATVYVWRSEDNFRSQFSPSTRSAGHQVCGQVHLPGEQSSHGLQEVLLDSQPMQLVCPCEPMFVLKHEDLLPALLHAGVVCVPPSVMKSVVKSILS